MNTAFIRHSGHLGAAVLATLFAVLFGVFAMHGVAAHGVGHPGGSHSALPGAAVVLDHHAGSEGHEHGGAGAVRNGDGVADHSPPSPGDHAGFSGEVCLAILCLLIALIVRAVRRGRTVRPIVVLSRHRPRLIPQGRPSEAPFLHGLSILRC